MKLEQKHIDLMKACENVATIWGYGDALLAREIQKFDPSFLKFIDNDELGKYDPEVEKLTGAERMPYFGLILQPDGLAYVERWEGERTMKFYEIHDPYYALIKATDKADAEKVYIESVADTDDYENFQEDEIREVERDYALVMFSQIQDHDGTCAGYDFISKVFNDPDFKVLKMDGSLL
ncbi:hypothetical protein SJY89_20200 [Bacillus velezensis]|nr:MULTISPECIES: hypothetical protein [Bacillus]MCW5196285.1 hypothetical protein [Bacillus amyloliquefaciens]MDU0078241.1 hypothetical protein [Bacillus sp. IG2]MDU0103949.1 hypothetical protein [Bacillus sp. IS1]MDX7897495.1 hypothetical protein [Bacillus velezensis]MDX8028468.1 hypothetical protein [Bacillus velezensis]